MKKYIVVALLWVALFMPTINAAEIDFQQSQNTATEHQLSIDQKSNELAKNQLLQQKKNHDHMLKFYSQKGVSLTALKHSQIDIISAKSTYDGLQLTVDAAKEQIGRVQHSIDEYTREHRRLKILTSEEPKAKVELTQIEQKLALANKLFSIENERLNVLRMTRSIAKEHLSLLEQWNQEIYALYKQQKRDSALFLATEKMKTLQSQLDQWIAKLSDLNNQLEAISGKEDSTDKDIQKINLQIIEANENVELARLDVYLLSIGSEVQATSESVVNEYSITRLNQYEQLTLTTKQELQQAEHFIKSKVNYLDLKKKEYQGSNDADDLSGLMMKLTQLQSRFDEQAQRVQDLIERLSRVQLRIKSSLSQQIATRQELPGFDMYGWHNLFNKSLQIPGMVVESSKTSVNHLKTYFQSVSQSTEGMLLFGIVLMAFSAFAVRYSLGILSTHLYGRRDRFTTDILYTIVELVRRSIFAIYLLGFLLCLSMYTGAHLNLFSYLTCVYIIFKTLINAARISLLESISDTSGEDVRLYYELKWAFLFGAILCAVIVLTHQLPVAYEVKALSNRVFMIFILLVGILLFHGRHIVPELVDAKITVRRRYVFHALRILTYLIPISLISTAIIGLFGYVDLAWTISKMQGTFLMVTATYLIVRGLMIDMFDYVSELAIKYSNNGWVWTEAFLKPFDKISRVLLFLSAIYALIHLYEWDRNAAFIRYTHNIINQHIFTLGGNNITPLMIAKLVVFVLVLYWASRWSREFSIRWWYSRYKDLGLRNSLSIFTQYLVVITGVIIGMQLIGMDLTGLAVITAAFFAGIGFGLRDMANNYFSGMLMLIERPFRKGDIVKVGEFEGEVIHLGMRSTTVRTWDHMEVIVPNADMFCKPFVNWTHQDSIVRSTITINVHRSNDPHTIHNLVLGVLAEHAAVLDSPLPAVLMREIGDMLVEMEVRYFIMLGHDRSRVRTRSEVLFAIWDCFQAHGIQPPIQEYEVQVQNARAGSRFTPEKSLL